LFLISSFLSKSLERAPRFVFTCAAVLVVYGAAALTVNPQALLDMRAWQWQNPLPQGNSINNVKFTPDKKNGWAWRDSSFAQWWLHLGRTNLSS
jgi:hypothetical protein